MTHVRVGKPSGLDLTKRTNIAVDERMEWDRGDEDTSPEPCENWAFAAVVGNVNDVGSVTIFVSK